MHLAIRVNIFFLEHLYTETMLYGGSTMVDQTESISRWQQHTAAIACGFLGDWLEQRRNPLALPMQFIADGRVIDPLEPAVSRPGRTLIVLIHGLMEMDSIWEYPQAPGAHYGTDLSGPLEATPLCLRFNSGRAIHENGAELSRQLELLVENWPREVERLVLLGHSMGGLMIRSACHHGRHQGHQWTLRSLDCAYLGSPHDGSWLAKGAQGMAGMMQRMPRDYLRVVGEFIDLRSEGIRNLSRGEVTPPDIEEPPLLPGADHYVVSGLLSRRQEHPVNALFGDALVHEASARGERRSGWSLTDTAAFPGVDHFRLAHHRLVGNQLLEWLA